MLFLARSPVNLIFVCGAAIMALLMAVSGLSISSLDPELSLPGGVVAVHARNFRPGLPGTSRVMVGEVAADVISASDDLIVVRMPDSPGASGIRLEADGERCGEFPFSLGTRLAGDLHPVANPVIAPDGGIITTVSGARGQRIAHPIVRVSREGDSTRYDCEVMNPTGLAFGPDGQLYVSSRSEGTVFRYAEYERLEVVADDLGICCGIVFDSRGNLLVGDRNGRILLIDPSGGRTVLAHLEPSVSAYHLAVDASDILYVTAPTISMRDALFRITRDGEVSALQTGLGRPQGMAFGPEGDLWVCASFGGRKGIFRYSPSRGTMVYAVAAPMLVGLAIEAEDLFAVDSACLYHLKTGRAPNPSA
jgi:sugar lactone lactonase YvrE